MFNVNNHVIISKMKLPNATKRKDRPIYVPYARRIQDALEASSSEKKIDDSIEFVGRFGRIGSYEFEYENIEDVERVLGEYNRYRRSNGLRIDLVKHVEAPEDVMMESKKMCFPGQMASDIEENLVLNSRGNQGKYTLLEEHELNLPSAYRDLHWRSVPLKKNTFSLSSSNHSIDKQNKMNKNSSATKRSITKTHDSLDKKNDQVNHHRKPNDDSVEYDRKKTDKLSNSDISNDQQENTLVNTDDSIKAVPIPTWRGFMLEIFNQFPRALAKRLLVAMWVNLFRSNLVVVGKTDNQLSEQPKNTSQEEIDHFLIKINKALQYFKMILNDVIEQLQDKLTTNESNKVHNVEAAHFICHLYIIMGDLCRYRDAQFKNSSHDNYNTYDTSTSNSLANLFRESSVFYQLACKVFPQEGRIYTQLANVNYELDDLLGQINSLFASILCTFRSHNEDILTVLLGKTSLSIVSVTGNEKDVLLIRNKIGLEQFDSVLEEVSILFEDLISASILFPLLDQLLKSLRLVILTIIESSGIAYNQISIGDKIDTKLKMISLKPKLFQFDDFQQYEFGLIINKFDQIFSDDTSSVSSFYVINDQQYEESALAISQLYAQLIMNFSDVFFINREFIYNSIKTNERFQLSLLILTRIAAIILDAVKSPLSPLLGLINFIVFWLYTTGLLDAQLILNDTTKSCNSNSKYTEIISQIQYFRRNICRLLYRYGKEAYKLDQLQCELLQYKIPEDDHFYSLLNVPLIFYVYCNESMTSTLNGKLFNIMDRHLTSVDSVETSSFVPGPSNDNSLVNIDNLFYDESTCMDLLIPSSSSQIDCVPSEKHHHNAVESSNDKETKELIDSNNNSSMHSTTPELNFNDIITSLSKNKEYEYKNIEANLLCPSNLTSLVRLARLLLLLGNSSDFKDEYILDKNNHLSQMKIKSQKNESFTNLKKNHTDHVKSINNDDQTVILKGKGLLELPSTDKRGLLKVKMNDSSKRGKESNDSQEKNSDASYIDDSCVSPILQNHSANDKHRNPQSQISVSETYFNKTNEKSISPSPQTERLNSISRSLIKVSNNVIKSMNDDVSKSKNIRQLFDTDAKNVDDFNHSDTDKCIFSTAVLNSINSLSIDSIEKTQRNNEKLFRRCCENKKVIVIDGSNVALRHGSSSQKKFSSLGIQLALDYYLKRDFTTIAFVPEYVIDYKSVGDNRRIQKAGVKITATKVPDNVKLLRDLSEQGLLIVTPAPDYDDSYIIEYARKHNGCIVSNDRYRDFQKDQPKDIQKWLKTHLISFTFISDEFMPNPHFVYPNS